MSNNIFQSKAILAQKYRRIFLYDYDLSITIGVFDYEQNAPQPVIINIEIFVPLKASSSKQDNINDVLDYNIIIQAIEENAKQNYQLQETLCDKILDTLLLHKDVHAVGIAMYKPNAYANAKGVGIERFKCKPKFTKYL
ncbi:MAG: Dihydroneopterin aldolase [Pseudomonadota bacterium]|jgi:dihydroneopterin aldolase